MQLMARLQAEAQQQPETVAGGAGAEVAGKPWSVRRLWPLLALALALGLCFALGGQEYLTLDSLRENRLWIMQAVAERPLLSILGFALLYVVVVALSIPGATILTICAGFMFGQAGGTVITVISATIGAAALFLIAKTTVGDALRGRAGPWLKKMERGFADGALSYLLVLRLVPLFPFFVVNLVPAFLGVPLATFLLATFVGIAPGSFVFSSVGAGLGTVFESGRAFSPAEALTPQIVTALVGLAILSLLPVIYRKLARARARRGG